MSRIVVTLAFYGMTMNSVNLSGDMFLNTLFGALTEIPGFMGIQRDPIFFSLSLNETDFFSIF